MAYASLERPSKTTSAVHHLRILIVENHTDCAESMATYLRLCGYDVEIADNGRRGLEMAAEIKPDVVLLNVGLPGMSGYDLARHLSGPRPQQTPMLIAITGYGRDEDRRRSKECGIDLHLVKPVEPEVLLTVLERFEKLLDGVAIG